MGIYINIFGLNISTYGLMIVLALAVANVIAYFLVKKDGLDIYDFIILETYGGVGGFVGAKILYLWVSRNDIDWSLFFNFKYFMLLMRGGFVFYGGLIGAIIAMFLFGKIHKIDTKMYLKKFVFLLPLMHGIGRIGCFLAGCCHGMPYDGFGAIVYPEGTGAPAGVKLFPIQLVEALGLMIIALILYILTTKKIELVVEMYIIFYAILRFVLEYFRADSIRGKWMVFSTSQWVSIILLVVVVIDFIIRYLYKKKA